MTVIVSYLTVFLLAMGWLTHWLIAVRKAGAAARAAKLPPPSLLDYWSADRYTTLLSVISLVVFYFVLPFVSSQWPLVAAAIGSTQDDPMNPLAAYLGGIASPWLADAAGKRLNAMIGADPPPK